MPPTDFVQHIKWLGHDSFRIEGSKTVYIDPFEVGEGPKGDIILVTHDHFDHCSPEDVAKVQADASIVITEKNSAAKLSGDVRILSPGESLTLGDVRISAVPAYNLDKHFHPKANDWLGFVIEMDGVRIYHAGDTDFIPEMKALTVDIALLPVSGTYVMTAAEAVEAALAIEPQIAIPMHFGAIVGGPTDAEHFKTSLAGKVEVRILESS